MALYESTDGDDWKRNDGWGTYDYRSYWIDSCTWDGVICNDDGSVTKLTLGNNNLTGTIPPELGNLTNLELLSLYGNDLTGTIPPELGNLSNLEGLLLHNNNLSGSIPPELGNLSNLEHLILSGNALSSSIPKQLGYLTNLRQVTLGGNNLSGHPIPEEVFQMCRTTVNCDF